MVGGWRREGGVVGGGREECGGWKKGKEKSVVGGGRREVGGRRREGGVWWVEGEGGRSAVGGRRREGVEGECDGWREKEGRSMEKIRMHAHSLP